MIKLRDYIGKSFFELIENGSVLSLDSLSRQKSAVLEDLKSIKQLIKIIEEEKRPMIQNRLDFENLKEVI